MTEQKALNDPTKGDLPDTGNHPSEFPDPPSDPNIEVGPDDEQEVGG